MGDPAQAKNKKAARDCASRRVACNVCCLRRWCWCLW